MKVDFIETQVFNDIQEIVYQLTYQKYIVKSEMKDRKAKETKVIPSKSQKMMTESQAMTLDKVYVHSPDTKSTKYVLNDSKIDLISAEIPVPNNESFDQIQAENKNLKEKLVEFGTQLAKQYIESEAHLAKKDKKILDLQENTRSKLEFTRIYQKTVRSKMMSELKEKARPCLYQTILSIKFSGQKFYPTWLVTINFFISRYKKVLVKFLTMKSRALDSEESSCWTG